MGKRKDVRVMPIADVLRETFTYDPLKGDLRWKIVNPFYKKARPGDIAGSISSQGYWMVRVAGCYYLAHRIIWKMVTGIEPEDQIDHIDNDRLNNRWDNFRQATNGQNRHNTKLAKNNKSGVKGVCWEPSHKAWKVYISVDGKQRRLGRYKSIDEAKRVRLAAAERLHGDFMRVA